MNNEPKSLPTQYYKKYDAILLPNLIKMRKLEMVMLSVAVIGMIMVWFLFVWLNFEGILDLDPVVIIDYPYWNTLFQRSYNFTWIMIFLHVILIYLRFSSKKLTIIPIERREDLKKDSAKQKEIEKETIYENQDSEFGMMLQNPRSYYIIGICGIGSLIAYLNYFPRKEQLFPSLVVVSESFAVIYTPMQYSSFFMVNIVFQMMILGLFLFQFFYGLRQFKDISKVIYNKRHNPDPKENQEVEKEDWKPPLPKPWNLMTFTEKKEYKAQVYAIEKQRAIAKEQEKLAKFIEIEREKRRLGEGLYKEQQKEKKLQEKIEKLEKNKKKDSQKDRGQYDFR